MTVLVNDPDFTLYVGDVLEVLAGMPDESVHCVVTSPPYWGLRDYGTGSWVGGNESCDHIAPGQGSKAQAAEMRERSERRGYNPSNAYANYGEGMTRSSDTFRESCGKCGAQRKDQQLGLEPTPDQYVENMVGVFREVRRVLRRDGTCWLNIGDSYANGPPSGTAGQWNGLSPLGGNRNAEESVKALQQVKRPPGLKPKDLVGVPWKLAQALQAPHYTGEIKQESDRAWLAALIDGEGCIYISKSPVGATTGRDRKYVRTQDCYAPGITITNRDRRLLDKAAEIVGHGTVQARKDDKYFEWRIYNDKAKAALRELYPHLVAKQEEARLAYGCPPSGDDARKAWESLKALHQGQAASIDFGEPEGMWERGWFLRSEIIWAKPNPMPESVTDRPTKSHEQVFLLTRSPRYFYDADAVRESAEYGRREWSSVNGNMASVGGGRGSATVSGGDPSAGRNLRSVWNIPTEPYPDAHFATFPQALVEPCVKAGTSEHGCCPECGAPWERQTEQTSASANAEREWQGVPEQQANRSQRQEPKKLGAVGTPEVKQLGWRPGCACHERSRMGVDYDVAIAPVPCVVLDPFMGSGTVAQVARKLGRRSIGIELNEAYARLCLERTRQLSLLAGAAP